MAKLTSFAKYGALEVVGGRLDFITLTSDGAGANNLLTNIDKVVQVVSLRGAPVIMGEPTATELKYAHQHAGSWTAVDLEAALLAHAGVTAEVVVEGEL